MASDPNSLPARAPSEKLPAELFLKFGDYLGRKDVYNAIRVNKHWFSQLIGLLWRSVPFDMLLKIPDGSGHQNNRRQFYANKIRKLNLEIDESMAVCSLEQLQLPCVRDLYFGSSIPGPPQGEQEAWLLPFQHTTLERLDWDGSGDLTTDLIAILQAYPTLRSFTLCRAVTTSDVNSLITFLRHCRCVRFYNIWYYKIETEEEINVTGQVLAGLFRGGLIEELSTIWRVDEWCADKFLQVLGSDPLPKNDKLQRLTFGGVWRAIQPLLSTATANLTELNLQVFQAGSDINNLLLRLTGLTKLRLETDGLQNSVYSTLDAISRLTQLETLAFGSCGMPSKLDLNSLTDSQFQAWISNLRQLRKLDLAWSCDTLTERAIMSISGNCPELEVCRLCWWQDLIDWRRLKRDTVLSSVRHFTLSGFMLSGAEPSHDEAKEIAEMIRNVFPNLKVFSLNPSQSGIRIMELVHDRVDPDREMTNANRYHSMVKGEEWDGDTETDWKEAWMWT